MLAGGECKAEARRRVESALMAELGNQGKEFYKLEKAADRSKPQLEAEAKKEGHIRAVVCAGSSKQEQFAYVNGHGWPRSEAD